MTRPALTFGLLLGLALAVGWRAGLLAAAFGLPFATMREMGADRLSAALGGVIGMLTIIIALAPRFGGR